MNQTEQLSWNQLLAQAISDPYVLAQRLQLDESWAQQALEASQDFPLRVPEPYCKRIKPGDPNDPLLLQVMPLAKELQPQPGYQTDPLNEKQFNPIPGLLHKYHGRVLLTLTGACGINCRYCFRRHFPYQNNNPRIANFNNIATYINNDPSINEVILSGGDPLLMKDSQLHKLFNTLSDIPHCKRIRIHTRMPIAIPQRINSTLIAALQSTRLQTIVVIHCNHPQEIDAQVAHSLQQMHQAGILVLNQSVLLHQVNDNADTLIQLSEALLQHNVLPYYLHRLDTVHGAAHFHVDNKTMLQLQHQLQSRLPGYGVPKFVYEEAGATSKVMLNPY